MVTEPLCAEIKDFVQKAAPAVNAEAAVTFTGRETLPLELAIRYTVSFEGKTPVKKGPLPAGVEPVGSENLLNQTLEDRVALARSELAGLMDNWAAAAQDYRREPKPENLMKSRPPFGFQIVCKTCGGAKQLSCSPCGGRGTTTCSRCNGGGWVTCSSCSGTGSTTCSSCGGRGTIEKVEWMMNIEEKTQTQSQMTQVRQVPCGSCSGGRVQCYTCNGGKVRCSTCVGTGTENCMNCGATGIVDCDGCAATGATHRPGIVECGIQKHVEMSMDKDHQEDLNTLMARTPLEALADFAEVRFKETRRNGSEVTLRYASNLPVESASVNVAGQVFNLRAYGPKRQIFFYHHMMEKLLAPSLDALEKGGNGKSPLAALKEFLSAEVHAALAQGGSAGSLPKQAAEYVTKGMMSESYARRAASAIEKCALDLYRRMAWNKAKWIVPGSAALWAFTQIVYRSTRGVIGWGEYAFIISAAVWFFSERSIAKGLRAPLGENLYKTMEPQFKKVRIKTRWIAGAAATGLWIIAGYIF